MTHSWPAPLLVPPTLVVHRSRAPILIRSPLLPLPQSTPYTPQLRVILKMPSLDATANAVPITSNGARPDDDEQEAPPDNGLGLEANPWGLEKMHDYEAGGHHPVHLGDTFGQRYKVVHKLRHAGSANVWLCRDISGDGPRYVALKILMADASTPDCRELRISGFIQRWF